MLKRRLGRSSIEVSAMGFGCWAIGGLAWRMNGSTRQPLSWSLVEDKESIRAINRALDLGVNFFDTADSYGCGHSERILGQALEGRREEVIIATKFGGIFDEKTKEWFGHPHPNGIVTSEFIYKACENSLKRLSTDYIDLYQFHWADYDPDLATDLLPVLENLVAEGKIRYYGWSTNNPERAQVFAEGEHCIAIQYHYNLLQRNETMLSLCEEFNLASIARAPLAMGLLTGKFNRDTQMPEDDVRHNWNFQKGILAEELEMLERIREVMTQDGRTLPQAALGWLWARGTQIIPIPGFKTVQQVEENASAMEFGPLSDKQIQEIDQILGVVQEPEKFDINSFITAIQSQSQVSKNEEDE
ncbi:MAG: aldo/keto reductase [Candidatus Hermodarchaeota archaeon]